MILYELNNYWYFGIMVLALGVMAFVWFLQNKKDKKKIFYQKNWNKKQVKNIVEIKIILLLVGLSLLLFAVWRPQWGQGTQDISRKGLDIVFTVDVSKSMRALDFSQRNELISRLDATKYLIKSFVKKRASDRVGLVEFAGESFVASPLTLDHSVFLNFLDTISSEDIGKQGTNLSEALEISLARLEVKDDKERSKVVILFSDGDETMNSKIEEIAKLIKDKGIVVYTIGVGSEKGMPIPDGQDALGRIVYKKYRGEEVITKLNPKPLKKIASITGGQYFHAESVADLKTLQRQMNTLPQKILRDTTLSPSQEQYWYFTLIGIILFIFGFVLPKNISVLQIKNLKKLKKKYDKK